MPIFHWLFKSPRSRREQCSKFQLTAVEEEEEEVKPGELIIYNKFASDKEISILLRREDCRACFYSTLQLKHLNSLNLDRQRYFGGLMGQHKAESVGIGCKVLPICDLASLGTCGSEVLEKEEQKKRKSASRMKELIRWAAAAKAGKGGIKRWKVLYFRNKMALKDSVDAASSGSSKLSFRWDEGRCSTSSSVFSLLSMPLPSKSDWPKYSQSSAVSLQSPLNDNASKLDCSKTESNRGGQWITSDSDFVVLEL